MAQRKQKQTEVKNKNRLGLVLGDFAQALILVGEVGTHGAKKYAPSDWLIVPNAHEIYKDALFRHLFADAAGEIHDEEGLVHAAQLAWNALAVLELKLREAQNDGE